MSPKEPTPPVVPERRASRRNPIQVRMQLADMVSTFLGRSVDVSRGGLFVASAETRRVGTLLRVRVLGPRGEAVFAVGVVVRCFSDLEGSHEGVLSPGMAIALTSTSEAWDRFWEDVSTTDGDDDDESNDDEDGT
ncbi:MAG TPA: PilZ domain-containing protein [Polyangia bacterium]|nr:PilZ domain-containing protein [Polyangia bacterium]